MSATKNPKEKIAVYETLSEWDEVLLGDEELFKELTEPHVPTLLKAARRSIHCEQMAGTIQKGWLSPEELTGETLIQAWQARHTRTEHKPLSQWLLAIQEKTLQRMIAEEQKLQASIVTSLDSPAPFKSEDVRDDENELWRLFEPQLYERWEDIIPDESNYSIAA
jgi:DNA-directed RNA polymerase specialized sigma24 family protein